MLHQASALQHDLNARLRSWSPSAATVGTVIPSTTEAEAMAQAEAMAMAKARTKAVAEWGTET
jgi:hypothetical protein